MWRATPALLLVLSALLVLFAIGARQRMRSLEMGAREVADRSLQAGATFTASLALEDQAHEFSLLDERRDLVLRASLWSRISSLSIGLALLSLVAAFVSLQLRAMWNAVDSRKAG